MLSRSDVFWKRALDLSLSVLGLLCTFWLIAIAWLLATVDCRANGFFTQTRIGLNGRRFKVIKIRTMRVTDPSQLEEEFDGSLIRIDGKWTTVTTANDPRVTRLGRFWRRTKIDEVPQLFNVVIGQMSLVGPRPDVPGFADRLEGEDRIVLAVRPGITGPATLKYRNEEELLADVENSEAYNREVIFPDKARLNREYVEHWSFWKDVSYILVTVFRRGGSADTIVDPKSRQYHSPEFKAKVDLETLRGVKMIRDGLEYGIHPVTVGQWKKAIQKQTKTLFEGKRGLKPVASHREPELLCGEIGKLKVELDWLKKKSGISR